MRWLPKTSAIYVEDPFEQPENSGRSVSAGQLKKIGEAFLLTYNLLISNNQNQSSILTQLVSPHVLRLIAKPVIPYYNVRPSIPNYNGGYPHLTQSQAQRGLLPHPHSKRHVQNGKAQSQLQRFYFKTRTNQCINYAGLVQTHILSIHIMRCASIWM